eukprot:TRINITY_DN66015_c0_g1_i1.p1 TRINITY_DN66015_c0_g1~~TRINITY_DN66015_c0_g1_i1.p1  ORF type:complete len:539 (+),score=151.08 TRINITY_DN66015_c0_g1_i1:82-1698(+)
MGEGYFQRAPYEKIEAGTKYERDDLWQGFEEKRHFRDKLCGIFFLLCLAGVAVVSAVAFHQGDLSVISTKANQDRSEVTKDFAALKSSRWTIVVCAVITAVLGFVWLEMLKRCTKVFIWGSFFGASALVMAVGVSVFSMGYEDNATSPLGLKIAGVVIMVLAVLVLVVLFCMRKRIAFSAEIVQQGCRGLQANFSLVTVVVPLLLLITFGFVIWWILTVVYLFSIKGDSVTCSDYSGDEDQCRMYGCAWTDPTCGGEGYDLKTAVRWAMLFLVFMYFWMTVFMAGAARFTVSAGLARWYWDFQRDEKGLSIGASLTGLAWAFTYHLGTIAKGSFMIAVIKFITWLLEMARKEETNKLLKCFLTCLTCCCRCIESLVQFVTRFAYICAAMHGGDFFDSCKEVNLLFRRQGGTLFLTDLIVHIVVRMGLFAAVGLVALGGGWYMHSRDDVSASSIIVLIFVCAAVFWVIGLCVEVAADTVIVCFLEDCERNDDTRNYRGPDDLMVTMKGAMERYSQAEHHVMTAEQGKAYATSGTAPVAH